MARLEVERKFALPDPDTLRQGVERLGAVWSPPVEQVDLYLAHPTRDFAATDEALRLRRVGDAVCVTYKGPKLDAVTKTRREIELPLPPGAANFAQWLELLAALGFHPAAEVRKRRAAAQVAWEGWNVEIALDQVEEVGEYVELEIEADEADLPAAQSALALLAHGLGLAADERRSYLELLLAGRVERVRE